MPVGFFRPGAGRISSHFSRSHRPSQIFFNPQEQDVCDAKENRDGRRSDLGHTAGRLWRQEVGTCSGGCTRCGDGPSARSGPRPRRRPPPHRLPQRTNWARACLARPAPCAMPLAWPVPPSRATRPTGARALPRARTRCTSTRSMALPLLGGAVWGGGASAGARVVPERSSRPLMGTQVDMAVEGVDGPQLRRAMDRAYAEMQRLEALMSRYQHRSVVSRINLAAGVTPVMVPAEVMAVLQGAQRVSATSRGAFDVTVGAFKSWNFGPGDKVVPGASEIARQLPLVDARSLVLDVAAGTAFLARQGMALDLGGIAKLPILEAGMNMLRSEGVENAMINGGGDVLTHGLWQGRPWRVGLRDPRSPERLLGVVAVAGAGVVASSGDYERFFFHQGQRQHHVLNPRTGRPASGVHGVSLVARDVAAVNGLGAALMVQGPQAGRALAQRMPGLAVLIAGQDGGVWQSTAMSALLEPVPS